MNWPWNRKEISQVWTWPHIFWLNIFGLWAEEAGSEKLRKWLSRYRFILCLYFTIINGMMLIAIGVKYVQGNILENMFTLFASCPGIVGCYKLFFIIRYRKKMKSAMNEISEMFLDVKDKVEERLIRHSSKRSWLIFSSYLTMGSCISFHWVFRPLINAAFYGEKTRIVDTWPVFIDTWPEFFISFFYQLPMILGVGHAFYFFDNMYFCYSECILCHFAVLKHRLYKLKLEKSKKYSKDLLDCIEYYAKILRICVLLRNSSSAVIIFQCISTVTILCSGVFIITMSENKDVNILMNLGEEVVVVTFVLYFYCWYSNEITFQCEDVCTNAYMSNWIDGTEKNKKNLLILMCRTRKPVKFGGILDIDLQTFITVLKATFSYYNFLIACLGKTEK